MKLAVTAHPLQIKNIIYYFCNCFHLLRVLEQIAIIKVDINLKGFSFGCLFYQRPC